MNLVVRVQPSVQTESDGSGIDVPVGIPDEEKCLHCGGLGHTRACNCDPSVYKPVAWLAIPEQNIVIWRCSNHVVTHDSQGRPVGEEVTCWECMGTGKK